MMKKKNWDILITLILLFQYLKYGNAGQVPAMFVFGDSLVDNGNNNYLNCFAKSNYYPYGVDFNGGPTGRFSNGRTVVDMIGLFYIINLIIVIDLLFIYLIWHTYYYYIIIGGLLGLPYIPAYADPSTTGLRVLGGVNYASAVAGILDETGQHFVSSIVIFTFSL